MIKVLVFILLTTQALTAASKTRCRKIELETKSCLLNFGTHKVKFSPDKIIFNNQIRRSLMNFPMTEVNIEEAKIGENKKTGKKILKPEVVVWHHIKYQKLGQRNFLMLQIWESKHSANKIQNLYWYIIEILKNSTKLHLSKVIKKRHSIEGTGKFFTDKALEFKLKYKNHRINWRVGREKGYL